MNLDVNKFEYSDAPQGSPEWVELRTGKPTASRLKDWLAVSKRDGKPLKGRTDYEAELAFENQFGVPFERFVTNAMKEGQEMEKFLIKEYSKVTGNIVRPVGCYHNAYFVASPDGEVDEDYLTTQKGLVEAKWVYDTTYSDVLVNGVPEAHMLQIQGQLWASDRKWCDYVVGNGNTNTFKVIRVERDEDTIKKISDSLKDGKLEVWANISDVFEFSQKPSQLMENNGEF